MKWAEYPFLRITAMLILGILASTLVIYYKFSWPYSKLFIVVYFLLYIFLSLYIKNPLFKKRYGSVGLLSFVFVGYLCAQLAHHIHKPSLLPNSISTAIYYTATINSTPSPTLKTTKYNVGIEKVFIHGKWLNVNDKAILYFKKDVQNDFDYGDKLLIKGHPEFLENQKNPYAFDYALFLQRRGIYLQDFISKEDFIIVNENHAASLAYLNLYIGDYFENIVANYISSERELNMVKALLIGRRDNITPAMEYAYESSGTTHILAVSGLHVGIIYFLFSAIFKFLKRGKLELIYYGINILAIWSFVFITGFSPSAQRAATMLTFILVAKLTHRKSSIYNTILASIFFILLISPNLLFSVSFQLSCTAVIGIVYLYKKIYLLVYFRHKIINFFWKITALSLSAQIATFPITIYYFNQFPTFFPVTNLIAIPIAFIVIIGGLLLLITSPLGIIPTLIGKILNFLIYYYNEIMVYISRHSFATIEDLYLKPLHVFLIILCLILALRFIDTKKLSFFRSFTLVLTLLSVWTMFDRIHKSQQREIIFYHGNNKQYFDIYLGQNCFTNINSETEDIRKDVIYNISPSRKFHLIENIYNIKNLDNVIEIGNNTLIHWNRNTILILSELHSITTKNVDITIDYLIIGKKIIPDIVELKNLMKIKNLILDSTVNQEAGKIIRDLMKGSDINIHSIQTDGAYKISF